MLTITIDEEEIYDSEKNLFMTLPKTTFSIEHSLLSISKWESRWKKPYLSENKKTDEEFLDYIRCMTITPNINKDVYKRIKNKNLKIIHEYIDDPMTATTFKQSESGQYASKIVTSEVIYYWMINFNIPIECQKWHLNRLLTLIRICSIKNNPPKKMSRKEIYSQNTAINAKRRSIINSLG